MNNQDIINELRRKNDIVDIISERIPLEKRGKNYFGVCPFHDDTNPSMSVSSEKQIYTCFSCHATGNVFTFLMNYEHKEFNQVLSDLAERVGITLKGVKVSRNNTKYDSWYKAYDIANKYYQNNLLTKDGINARLYLKARGIDEQIIKEFEIGFSLYKRDDLTKLLTMKNNSLDFLNKIGLSSEDHDIYNGRVMFPLHDLTGNVIGFSGRIITSGKQNKYLNTKETELFKKGKLLYHYHIAKDVARVSKSVIIMEGFMDVIRASSIGLKNTVATMGTALTKDHIKEIKRLSNNIYLCFDGDAAGVKATISAGELFMESGLEVKVIVLDNDDDPDTYILKNGKDAFISVLNNAIYYSDFKINNLSLNHNFKSSEDKANYIHDVLLETLKINDAIRVEIILKDLAKKFEIGYNTLEKSFQELVKENSNLKVNEKEKKLISIPENRQLMKKDMYQKASLNILYYMINNEEIIDWVEKMHPIFPTELLRALECEIVFFYHKYGFINVADFYTYLSTKKELANLLNDVIELDLNDNPSEKELNDYIRVIKEYNYKKTIASLKMKIANETDPLMQLEYAEKIRKLRIGEN